MKHYFYTNINIYCTEDCKETRRNECQKCLNYFKHHVWPPLAQYICRCPENVFIIFIINIATPIITIVLCDDNAIVPFVKPAVDNRWRRVWPLQHEPALISVVALCNIS